MLYVNPQNGIPDDQEVGTKVDLDGDAADVNQGENVSTQWQDVLKGE